MASSDLDERIAKNRAEHSCLKRLDQFMYCMTLTHQMDSYYRNGTYGDCPRLFHNWQACLRTKLRKPLRDARLHDDHQHEAQLHVFAFRQEYLDADAGGT